MTLVTGLADVRQVGQASIIGEGPALRTALTRHGACFRWGFCRPTAGPEMRTGGVSTR